MWSNLFSFLFGAFAAILGIFILLFRWNVTPSLDSYLAQRRAKLPPTPFEQKQQTFFLTHQGTTETAVWANSIAGYVFTHISQLVNDTAADGRLESYLNQKVLSKIKYPHFVTPVLVSDLSIGSSLPTIEAVSVIQADPTQPLIFDLSISYHGSAFICVESGVGMNAPIANLAVLPIELALQNLQFDFKARMQLDVSNMPTVNVTLSLLASDPQPSFDFELHSHIGSALILSDLHILQTIFQRVLQELLETEIIEPHAIEFNVKLW